MHARRTILLLATLLVASCGTEAPPGSGGSANPGDVTRALAGDRNLTGANLAGANLTSSNLTNANLTVANVTSATFTGANLNYADLTSATLTGAIFTGANLGGAILTGVHCDATTRWPDGFTPPTCLP